MGKIEAPFFGASKKEIGREKAERYAILRNAERRALGFAGAASAIDAVEVVKGAASPPAPEAWRAAVRETVYALRQGAGPIRAGDSQLDSSAKKGLGGFQLHQRLDPPLPPLVEPKAQPSARL